MDMCMCAFVRFRVTGIKLQVLIHYTYCTRDYLAGSAQLKLFKLLVKRAKHLIKSPIRDNSCVNRLSLANF
uniref:Uncharacterized protein n=1 Tax=Glossina morsitans morsitans TaxID=37546 RepID=A0A1B0FP87_GLOMM